MKRICTIILICMLGLVCCPCHSQTRAEDSLRHYIETAGTDREKLPAVIQLSELILDTDTSLPYVIMAETMAAKTKEKFDLDRAAYARAFYYVRKNEVDSALHIVDRMIPGYKNDDSRKKFYLDLLFLKAKILDRGNRYSQSLTQLYKVLETAGAQKDTLIQIQAKTGIGWVQMEMEQYREALHWLLDALHTSPDKKFYQNYGALYSNLAATYNALGKADSAQAYIEIAIKDARENSNLRFLATALSMQAKIFIDSRRSQLAEAPLHEIVEIRKKLNDPFYTVYDMSTLASYYASNKQTAKGIELCREGITLAKKNGLSSQLLMIYHALAENYKAAGNAAEYGKTLEAIIALKDSFNNINSSKILADMQANSETLKNERTIAEQQLNLTKKNYWLFGSVLFAILGAVIVWLAFKNYRRKQSIKMKMALDEEKRIAAQSISIAEEQERKRIAADLHDNIGAYASAISADVEKLTNNGAGTSAASLQNLQQHSQEIINSLRDTIWVLNKDNITITGISDRIKNYINKLRPSYGHIQFHISEEIRNDARLSSQHALNIFRIIQEATHNALKHSGAANISIRIHSDEIISIKISDDGKGMESRNTIRGNGLQNMESRAGEIGMQLSVTSKAQEGTTLSLETGTTN